LPKIESKIAWTFCNLLFLLNLRSNIRRIFVRIYDIAGSIRPPRIHIVDSSDGKKNIERPAPHHKASGVLAFGDSGSVLGVLVGRCRSQGKD